MPDSPDHPTPRLDAADRLERVIDAQSVTLDRIDDKSGRIARLLGILLGVVLSSVSLSTQLTGVSLESLSTPVRLTFLIGVGFLLLALAGSIVTLLSSKYKIGLGHGVGVLLSRRDYDVSTETHLRRVLGTYAETVKLNYEIVELNARRLRRTLGAFLIGLFYLALSAVFVLTGFSAMIQWLVVVVSVPTSLGVGWFTASNNYLPIETKVVRNE